jgi:hypothetical protein
VKDRDDELSTADLAGQSAGSSGGGGGATVADERALREDAGQMGEARTVPPGDHDGLDDRPPRDRADLSADGPGPDVADPPYRGAAVGYDMTDREAGGFSGTGDRGAGGLDGAPDRGMAGGYDTTDRGVAGGYDTTDRGAGGFGGPADQRGGLGGTGDRGAGGFDGAADRAGGGMSGGGFGGPPADRDVAAGSGYAQGGPGDSGEFAGAAAQRDAAAYADAPRDRGSIAGGGAEATGDLSREPAGGTADSAAGPLLPAAESEGFRARWTDVQTGFVDAPRRAVEQADSLVAELMQHLAKTFADERSQLEGQWDRGDDVPTDDLRTAFQRYRSFFERLLST